RWDTDDPGIPAGRTAGQRPPRRGGRQGSRAECPCEAPNLGRTHALLAVRQDPATCKSCARGASGARLRPSAPLGAAGAERIVAGAVLENDRLQEKRLRIVLPRRADR